MTPAEFRDLIARFVLRPTVPAGGERHVYLWHGQPEALRAFLPRDAAWLSLHDLARSLARRPDDTGAARRVLEKAIDATLVHLEAQGAGPQVIVVEGCDLLMRYGVSLGRFFASAGDSRLLVLLAPPYAQRTHVVSHLATLNLDATYDYLRSRVPEGAIVSQPG